MSKKIIYYKPINMDLLNTDEVYNTETAFTIQDIPVSLANSLRRVLISNIPIACFDDTWDDREELRSIVINKNTSGIHNEFLAHRLSLVPLNMDNEFLKLKTYYDKNTCKRIIMFNNDYTPTFEIKVKFLYF